jgi:endonuclease YncB( thermonuclease family)
VLLQHPFIIVLLLLLSGATQAQELEGEVVGIADGDTFTLLVDDVQYRVRLSGIDTPERGQPYANAARDALSDLIFRKQVRVENRKTDRYGRIIGRVWVQPRDCARCGKTLDVSLALLTTGMAWWYRYYAREQPEEERGQYEFAEFEAKAKGAGLWQDENPVPPWEWRAAKR